MATWVSGPAPVVLAGVPAAVPAAAALQPFSTTLTFTTSAHILRQQVTGPLAFTYNATGAVPFVSVDLQLVADGVNAPTFFPFKEAAGSAGYVNTAGIINYVHLWFTGAVFMYSILQTVSPVAVPRIVSVAATDATTVTLTLSGTNLNTTVVPPVTAFAVRSGSASAAVVGVQVSATTVTLATSRSIASGDAVSYIMPLTSGLVAAGTGECVGCATFYVGAPVCTATPTLSTASPVMGTAVTVTTGTWSNTPLSYAYQWYYADTGAAITDATSSSYTPVVADAAHTFMCVVTATNAGGSQSVNTAATGVVTIYERLTTNPTMVVALIETVNGAGYNYGSLTDSASNINANPAAGITATVLPAATSSGSVSFVYGGNGTSVDGIMFGLSHLRTVGTWDLRSQGAYNIDFGLYASRSGSSVYRILESGAIRAQTLSPKAAFVTNDVLRMRKSGTTLYAEVSKDSGSTYSIMYSWTLTGAYLTYDYNALFTCCKPQQIVLPRSIGFV